MLRTKIIGSSNKSTQAFGINEACKRVKTRRATILMHVSHISTPFMIEWWDIFSILKLVSVQFPLVCSSYARPLSTSISSSTSSSAKTTFSSSGSSSFPSISGAFGTGEIGSLGVSIFTLGTGSHSINFSHILFLLLWPSFPHAVQVLTFLFFRWESTPSTTAG